MSSRTSSRCRALSIVAIVFFAGLVTGGGLGSSNAAAATLPLDPTFDPAGAQPGLLPTSSAPWNLPGFVGSVVSLPGGGMLVMSGTSPAQLAKLRSDGSLDPSFGDSSTPGKVQISHGGSIVVDRAGNIIVSDGQAVWRVSPAGVLDTTPLIESTSSNDPFWPDVRAIGVDPSNHVLVVGSGSSLMSRLTDTGQIDTTYASSSSLPGQVQLFNVGRQFLVRPDGGVMVVEGSGLVAEVRHVLPDGTVDAAFANGQGVAPLAPGLGSIEVDKAAVDAGGRLLTAGVTLPACSHCAWISRMSSTGSFDQQFTTNATASAAILEGVGELLPLADGHVLVFGQVAAGQIGVLTLDAIGRVDPSFGWAGATAGYSAVTSVTGGSPAGAVLDDAGRLVLWNVFGGLARTVAPAGGSFVALTPGRLLESRVGAAATVDGESSGIGARGAGSVTELRVGGRGGVPVDASAVVLNVTVTGALGGGYVSVYPCGVGLPNASNLNFVPGQTIPNAVVSKVGVGGKVCVFTSAATDLIVDVNGYFPSSSAFASLPPNRLLESRRAAAPTVDGVLSGIGVRAAGSVTELSIGGRIGIPTDAAAAVLNVTVTGAQGDGYVSVYPCSSTPPNASNLNFVTGDTIANAVITKLDSNGRACVFTSATTDLIVDVGGWFPAGGSFVALTPGRLLESRVGAAATVDGESSGIGARGAGSVTELRVGGRGGVPVDASAVVLNVTVTGALGGGYVSVYPCGVGLPNASNLNFVPGQTIPNAVVSKVGVGGKVCVFTSAATDLIVDVNGYW